MARVTGDFAGDRPLKYKVIIPFSSSPQALPSYIYSVDFQCRGRNQGVKNLKFSVELFIITGDISGRFDPTYILGFEALILTSSTPPVTVQYVAGRRRIFGLKFRPPKLPRLIRAFPLRIGLRGSYESCSLRCDVHSGKIW